MFYSIGSTGGAWKHDKFKELEEEEKPSSTTK